MLHSGCRYGVVLWLAAAVVAGSAVAAPEAGDGADDANDVEGNSYSISDEPDVQGVPIDADADADADTDAEVDAEVDDADLPMVEIIPQDRRVRHDWYLGAGLGAGGGVSSVKAGNALGVTELGRKGGIGASLFFHAGGRLREKVYLGSRFAVVGGSVSVAGTSLMFEALYFPLAKRGLLLGAAVGPAVVTGPKDAMGKNPTRFAAGLAADIGYDFWLLSRFNLGIVLQANAVLNNKQAHIFMGTLGLQFNLY